MCCAGFDVGLGHVLCLFLCSFGHVLCLFPMQIAVICAEVHFIPWSVHLDYEGTCIDHCLAGIMFHGVVALLTFCRGCASPFESRVVRFCQVLTSCKANYFWLGCQSMWCVQGLHTHVIVALKVLCNAALILIGPV